MPTRSSKNWKANNPGGWDALNTRLLFPPHSLPYGIPIMGHPVITVPKRLLPFSQPARKREPGAVCHFFLDDYRFERVWNRPIVYIARLKLYDAVLTPDFSLYTDWPHAMNIWNTYRNRWLGCFWQAHGINTIPTIGWAGPDSFAYAFLGVPRGSVVAIATPDIRHKTVLARFALGLHEMIRVIDPSLVIVYGSIPLNVLESYPDTQFKFYGGYGERFNAKPQSEKDGEENLSEVQETCPQAG
jgi:hypothetical protein